MGKSNADGVASGRSDGLQSVAKALGVLQRVAETESGMTLSEVVRAVEMPVTTVARLLKTLEQTGYLRRDDASRYSPGTVLIQIGAQALSRSSLYELAEQRLIQMSEFTGETAYLAVLAGSGRAVYLRQVESPRAIRHASWTGRTIATAGTAVGSALEGKVGEQGFARSRATAIEPDAAAVAAPVIDRSGEIVGAISVIGPSFRMSDEQLQSYGVFIRKQALELSSQLL